MMRRAKTLNNVVVISSSIVIALVLVLCCVAGSAQDRAPDTGFKAANSYSISDIENVNLSNGNLMLNIPLASLPAGRGTSPGFSVSLNYNSKLWASKQDLRTDGVGNNPGDQFYNRELLVPNDHNGWVVNAGGYSLKLVNRLDLEREALCVTYFGEDEFRRNAFRFKLVLTLPNGDTREFKPNGNTEYPSHADGFFSLDPWQVRHTSSYTMIGKDQTPSCGTTAVLEPGAGVDYFTDDGSQLRMFVPYQPGVVVPQMRFTLYLPDGQIVENKPPDDSSIFQRVTDRNGNKLVWRAATLNGHSGFKIEDDLLRYIFVGQDRVIQPGVSGTPIETVFHWTTKYVNRHYRATTATNANPAYLYADLAQSLYVIDQITLPSQAGSRQYTFTYNAADSPPGGSTYTYGWGELKSVSLPGGASANYAYSLDGNSSIELEGFNIIANSAVSRQLSYQTEYDGQTVSATPEPTYYATAPGAGSSTSPAGTVQFQHSAIGGELNGYAYRTTQTVASMPNGGSMTEKIWVAKRPSGTGPDLKIEPIVKTEFTSIPDANGNPVLTATKDYEYDQNGNVLEIKEYDWVAYSSVPRSPANCQPATGETLPVPRPCGLPAGLTLKRKTVNTYYYETPNILTPGPNSSYHHSNPTAPKLLHLLKSSEVRDATGTVMSRTENYYDGGTASPLIGNLTQTKTWDSTKGPVSNPLASWNSVSTSTTYDQYGNPTQANDAKDNVTHITYGSVGGFTGLYPTQTISAYGTNVARTSIAAYDFYTGLVTSVTDVDNNYATTSTGYDPLGRPTSVSAPNGAQATTTYNDVARRVTVRSDIQTAGDPKKVATTFYDQLGRVRLVKTLEDAATQSADNEMDGIKVQTRYHISNPNSYQVTSNPYRANYSYNAGGEETMGWTRSTSANTGRLSEVETFSGVGLPGPWGGNGASTGIVRTEVDSNSSTVTDQALKKRRSITNALGQLQRVDEPDLNGNLGSVTSPTQPTSYSYDTLGNMITVQQGSQYRYFLYSSMGRLLRVRQPEQEVNGNLSLSGHPTNSSWTAGFTYDNNGNVLTTIDAKNTTITNNGYDALNRPASRSYSDGTPSVNFSYDGNGVTPTPTNAKGKLTKVSNTISETTYNNFDIAGRLTSSTQRTPLDDETISTATPRTSSYVYNVSGALVQQTYPSQRVVNNEFEPDGDIARIYGRPNPSASEQTYANSFSYFADGKIEKLKLGNQLWEKAKLNSRLQATEIAVGYSPGDGSVAKFNYEYGELSQDGNSVNTGQNTGNIAKQMVTFAGQTAPFVQTYRYDSLDRLKEATEKVNGVQSWRQTFGYDLYGNRTAFSQVVGNNHMPINNMTLPSVDQSKNRFNLGQGYTYDANGNIIQDVDPVTGHTRSFTFNGDNKQTQVTDTTTSQVKGTYFYDGSGSRVKKVTADETTVFVYDGMGKLVAEYSTATPPPNPTIHYTATDTLGSPRVITNGAGQVESRRDFLPFGEELFADGTYRKTSDNYTTTGTDAVRQRFTGYQKDTETGLDFAQARYYQNQHGRFTAIDPLLSSGRSAQPQTFNRYVYVANNPISRTDPTGMDWYKEKSVVVTYGGTFTTNIPVWHDGTVFGKEKWTEGVYYVGYGKGKGKWTTLDPYSSDWTLSNSRKAAVAASAGYSRKRNVDLAGGAVAAVAETMDSVGIPVHRSAAMAVMDAVGLGPDESSQVFTTTNRTAHATMIVASVVSGDILGEVNNHRGLGPVLYRGIKPKHEGFAAALEGRAEPWGMGPGGHDSPWLHNKVGKTESSFTSWTTDIAVAEGEAQSGGVILQGRFPRSRMVRSPDFYWESETLITGRVDGAAAGRTP